MRDIEKRALDRMKDRSSTRHVRFSTVTGEDDIPVMALRHSAQVIPHNRQSPVDLQRTPRCYLCGGQWTLRADLHRPKLAGSRIVECTGCELVTWARWDEAVWQMRGW
jgi:hypothetical protein